MAIWELTLLGRLEARKGERTISRLTSRKAGTLLALLVLEPRRHSRDELAERIWGAETPLTKRQNLRRALADLRSALDETLFDTDRDTICLRPGAFRSDWDALEAARRHAREEPGRDAALWKRVVTLDTGELVPELSEGALFLHQLRHQEERQRTLETLAALHGEHGDTESEQLYRQRLHAHPTSRRESSSSVPRPLRPLVGRSAAREAICRFLRPGGIRLLTITGPGGMGKTRLAIEVAGALAADFPTVAWCPLVELGAPDAVLSAAARALGIRSHATQDPLEALETGLNRPALLVLDNAEHLLPKVASVILSLLEGVAGLTCLVTSRRPLGIVGEQEFPLAPLTAAESSALLHERVEALGPGRAWDEVAAARLCALLDGIPLAIELAASRVRTESLSALTDALGKEGVGGLRASDERPERHQTLRTAIAGSLAPLAPQVAPRFDALGVFSGPFSLRAAAAVWGLSQSDASNLLDVFVRDCIVSPAQSPDVPRFRLLEPIRETACERLAASPPMEQKMRRRHADYYLALASEIEAHRRRDQSALSYQRLETENANLRAALLFALSDTPARAVAAIQTVRVLSWSWRIRGMATETASYRYEERFLSRESELSQSDRWLALLVRGQLFWRSGQLDEAEKILDEAHRLAEGPQRWRDVPAGHLLAHLRRDQGHHEEAYALMEELAGDAERAGESDQAGWLLADLAGMLHAARDWPRWHSIAMRARVLENASHGLPPDAPNPVWDSELARQAAQEGRWPEAERLMRSAVTGFANAGWRLWEAGVLYELGHFVERQGRREESIPLYQRSLALFEELDEPGQLVLARQRVARLVSNPS